MTSSARLRTFAGVLVCGAALAALGFAVGMHPTARWWAGAEVPTLKPGTTRDLSFALSQVARFRVAARAGSVVRLTVDRPAALVVRLIAPGGEMVAESHRAEVRESPIRLSFVAEQDGDYRLEVRGRDQAGPSGPHRVTVDQSRAASADDRIRARAERAFEAGDALRRQESAAAVRASVAQYESALQLWSSIGDAQGEADAWLALGRARDFVSQFEEALLAYTRSLARRAPETDVAAEAQAFNGLGFLYWRLGEIERAVDAYGQALAKARSADDRWMEVDALNNTARIGSDRGDLMGALAGHAAAIAISHSINDRRSEGFAFNNTGNILQTLGDMDAALEAYAKALVLRRSANDGVGIAATLGNVGRVHRAEGRLTEALESFERALPISRTTGSRDTEGRTLLQLGTTHHQLGHQTAALDLLAQAVAICSSVRDGFCEAEALNSLAMVKASMGRTQEASAHVSRAQTLMRARGDRIGVARTHVIAADVHAREAALDAARSDVEAAIEIIESQRTAVASPDLRASYLATSRAAYELYIDVLMRLHAADPRGSYAAEALRVSEQARARTLIDALAESRKGIREGVASTLLVREQDIRSRLNEAASRLNRSGGAVAPDRQRLERELDDLMGRYRRVEADIRAASPRYAALTQPVTLGLRQIQRQLLDSDSVLLEYALGQERSYVWAITASSMDVRVLPGRDAIEKVARRAYDLLQHSHRPAVDTQAQRAVAELSDLILTPVAGALADRRLLVVPDGALQFVPFAALPSPRPGPLGVREPLLVRHEIVVLPSASAMAAVRADAPARPKADRMLALLADPVLQPTDPRVRPGANRLAAVTADSSAMSDLVRSANDTGASAFQRLRFTRDEAQTITRLAGDAGTLTALDFDASRETALNPNLGRYRIVHFATHALLNTRHPELSGIVLSLVAPDGTPQDGFLRLHDIYNLRLGADLVVLSACETALGRDVKGEGLIGLTRGFMYAGAPRVVASLWDVRDQQTSALMTRFYAAMLRDGERPAAALRRAQLSMLRDPAWSAPVYWAGFVLQGEWK